MTFYIRQSLSVGPIRFNLSKSGLGVSAGVRGLRVGTGPRGNYVHVGRHGLYYRKSIPPVKTTASVTPSSESALPEHSYTCDGLTEIDSGSVSNMTPNSAAEILFDINEKSSRWSISAILIVLSLSAAAAIFYSGMREYAVIPIIVAAVALVFTLRIDKLRRSSVLLYDFDDVFSPFYEFLVRKFENLERAKKVWHVEASGRTSDWKQNAGANTLIRRNETKISYKPPHPIVSNVSIPNLKMGKQTLAFCPDCVLVFDGKKWGAVTYGELVLKVTATNFVEDGKVPSDARILWHTWRRPNRDGGPDRRFKDNYQIPVCEYEEAHFHSGSGLNELIQVSKIGLLDGVLEALENMRTYFRLSGAKQV